MCKSKPWSKRCVWKIVLRAMCGMDRRQVSGEGKGQAGVTACDLNGVEVTGVERQCGVSRCSAWRGCCLPFGPKFLFSFFKITFQLFFITTPLPNPERFPMALSCFSALNILLLHECPEGQPFRVPSGEHGHPCCPPPRAPRGFLSGGHFCWALEITALLPYFDCEPTVVSDSGGSPLPNRLVKAIKKNSC